MRYTNLFCVSCFMELIRPQLTCGKSSCMTAWKDMTDDQKDRARGLAAMTRSERALASIEETAIRADERKQRLDAAREQLESYQAKKVDDGFMPKSLRDALIANAPIKHEEPNGNTEPIDADNTDPTDH